jgi:hypothetical protein
VLLPGRLRELESLAECLARGWPALLVGGPSSGKSSLARIAAALAGWRGWKLSPMHTADQQALRQPGNEEAGKGSIAGPTYCANGLRVFELLQDLGS